MNMFQMMALVGFIFIGYAVVANDPLLLQGLGFGWIIALLLWIINILNDIRTQNETNP